VASFLAGFADRQRVEVHALWLGALAGAGVETKLMPIADEWRKCQESLMRIKEIRRQHRREEQEAIA
jgi:hypothetical protein